MDRFKFLYIGITLVLLFSLLTYTYHVKVQENTINNAKAKINDMLLNYKALRSYVSNVQKKEVYRLQESGQIDSEYFAPQLLSSTYSSRTVNSFYNEFRKELGFGLIEVRFASDNPRNPLNKATKKESELITQFNNKEIEEYIEIVEKDGEKTLYYVLPTKPTAPKCMKCHSTPDIAPKDLIKTYGDTAGFYEKVGDIRAILSTSYSLDRDLQNANKIFLALTFITLGVFILLGVIVYYFISKLDRSNKELDEKVKTRTQDLEDEKEYIQKILDINPSIIFVVNNGNIINGNKQFFKYFKCKSTQEFSSKTDCVSRYFLDFDGKPFPKNKMIDEKEWCKYLVETNETVHYVTIKFDTEVNSFIINASYLHQKKDILVTLQDITEQKKKDQILFEQSKLASMSEMIDNIAHQWRQPLSVIATSATGMQMKKEYQLLSDEEFHSSCEAINENTQLLSQTIDELRSFIKNDEEQKKFQLQKTLQNCVDLLKTTAGSNKITIICKSDKIELYGYPNELFQILVNFYNNSKDAFIINENSTDKRIILISTKRYKESLEIIFQDSAGGIDESIINNIFEPYFTTKHKSQGVGMGLHMAYTLVTEKMEGSLVVNNGSFEYENEKYFGAVFTITLPL